MKEVYRRDDMSQKNHLSVTLQNDGDIIVRLFVEKNIEDNYGSSSYSQVEFCSVGSGGGRSPRTLKALFALMDAIHLDNIENPIPNNPEDYL